MTPHEPAARGSGAGQARNAMDQFLATPELLEVMFLHSEMRMVLVVYPLVCRQWNAIIQKSPAVQVHLFKRSDPRQKPSTPRLNPVLSALFRPFFAGSTAAESAGFLGREHFEQLALARKPEPFLRRGASWRRMHVRQPPLRVLGVSTPPTYFSTMRRPEVTMGMLYDLVSQIVTDPRQQWRMVWGELTGVTADSPFGQAYYASTTQHLLHEADAVLVRGATSVLPMIRLAPKDRDFLTRFRHPDSLTSPGLEMRVPNPSNGLRSQGEHRQL